jgi:hypothetical protein
MPGNAGEGRMPRERHRSSPEDRLKWYSNGVVSWLRATLLTFPTFVSGI